MEQILLCKDHIPPVTNIYNSFIQNEMLDANGSYVKVYLYLSMCIQSGNASFSISSLADRMENTEKDIIRALNYWEKRGLLSFQSGEEENTAPISCTVTLPQKSEKQTQSVPPTPPVQTAQPVPTQPVQAAQPIPTQSVQAAQPVPTQSVQASQPVPTQSVQQIQTTKTTQTKQEKTPPPEAIPSAPESFDAKKNIQVTEEQTMRLTNDSGFQWVSQIVESFLERPLNPKEIQLLMYLYDELHFSRELILYLYEYCCTLGKTSLQYVQAVAFSWADQNVTTPEQAKAASNSYHATRTAIAKAFGLNRSLGSIELQYVNRWNQEWDFDLSVILEACNRTMLSLQRADFKYTDRILASWYKNGVRNKHDIQICDENHSKQKPKDIIPSPKSYSTPAKGNQFHQFQQREVSLEEMNELERRLLSRSYGGGCNGIK